MLKTLAAAFVALIGLQSHAELPNACHMGCSEQQVEILEKFNQAPGFSAEFESTLYSGTCYHSSMYYNGKQAHHGVILLKTDPTGLHMFGRFSFFAPENPYAGWTLADAEKNLDAQIEAKRRIQTKESYGFIDYNVDGEFPWSYYLRHSAEGDLLVQGFWGERHGLFCELKRH